MRFAVALQGTAGGVGAVVPERAGGVEADPPVPILEQDRREGLRHRRRAAVCVHRGEWRQARAHYWQWWRRKPDSSKALRGLVRSLFRRQ